MEIVSVILTIEAVIFLLRNNIGTSSRLFSRVMANREISDRRIMEELATQSANNWIGVAYLIIAFLLQMRILLDFPAWAEMGSPKLKDIIISIIVGLVLYLLGTKTAKFIQRKHMAYFYNISENPDETDQ